MLKCLILEDQPEEIQNLCSYIEENSETTLLEIVNAESSLKKNIPNADIIFADILINGEVRGIDWMKNLEKPVIFISNHAKYALQSFEAKPLHFLQKPITQEQFLVAIERAKAFLAGNKNPADNYFFIKQDHFYQKIIHTDILFAEAQKDYTKIVTSNGTYLALFNLKKLLNQLPNPPFVRTHRSYIVNAQKIEQLNNHSLTIGSHNLPIGNAYQDDFFKQYLANKVLSR